MNPIITSRMHLSDLGEMRDIHEKLDFEWKTPVLSIGTIVVRDSRTDKMIGAGFLRPLVEAVMILDPDLPKKVRAKALFLMLHQAIADTRDTNLDELYAWVHNNPEYSELLHKHYKFDILHNTTSLRLRL